MTTTETVLRLIRAERDHQIAKGYGPDHDGTHTADELLQGASAFLLFAQGGTRENCLTDWPFEEQAFRPNNRLDAIVKATAMLVAELERRERIQSPNFQELPEMTLRSRGIQEEERRQSEALGAQTFSEPRIEPVGDRFAVRLGSSRWLGVDMRVRYHLADSVLWPSLPSALAALANYGEPAKTNQP